MPSLRSLGHTSALNGRFAGGPITASIKLPDTASVAASYEDKKVEVLADWTWTGWSSIQDLTIKRDPQTVLSSVPLNFKDTWRAGLGVNYELSDPWTLRVGTAYDKTPVQDVYRTPRLPDGDRVWAAVGFQYKVGKSGAFDFGYAHLFVKDGTSSLPNQAVQPVPSATPPVMTPPSGNLVGNYTSSVNVVSIQYRHSF